MEYSKVIRLRKSTRAFKPEQISDEALKAVLEAAYLAPVGMAEYEKIRLTVVQDQKVIARMEEIAAEAMGGQKDFHPAYGAQTLVYVSESTADGDMITGCNTGCIMENMMLAAVDQGLGTVYLMGMVQAPGPNPEIPQLLNLPEGFRPVSAVALGYAAEPAEEREVTEKIVTNYVK